jgi:hypothetical protein
VSRWRLRRQGTLRERVNYCYTRIQGINISMRYIAIGILVLFGGCLSTNRFLTEPEEVPPVLIDPEAAGIIDRNNDGLVSGAEIDAVSNNPSSLTVFIWLISAVIIAVVVTIIISKWSTNDAKDEVPGKKIVLEEEKSIKPKKATPIYADKKINGEGVSGSPETDTSTTTDTE